MSQSSETPLGDAVSLVQRSIDSSRTRNSSRQTHSEPIVILRKSSHACRLSQLRACAIEFTDNDAGPRLYDSGGRVHPRELPR